MITDNTIKNITYSSILKITTSENYMQSKLRDSRKYVCGSSSDVCFRILIMADIHERPVAVYNIVVGIIPCY